MSSPDRGIVADVLATGQHLLEPAPVPHTEKVRPFSGAGARMGIPEFSAYSGT